MSEVDAVLVALSETLGPVEGDVVTLDGGITNRNYRVSFGGRDVVVRVPGRDTKVLGIDREAEGVAAELAAALGIGPAVVARLDDPACLVCEFVEGRALVEGELASAPELVRAAAGALRRLHDSGGSIPARFDGLEVVRAYEAAARARGARIPDDYEGAVARATADAPPWEPVPCHNDLLAANLIVDGERLRVIDWEYAGMGDRWFDLGNLAVNNELDSAASDRLLEAYWGRAVGDDDRERLRRARFLSDLREAMWAVLQSVVSDLDVDFEAHAGELFARLGRANAG